MISNNNLCKTEKYEIRGSCNTIKTITREVIRECAKLDVQVTENVVSVAINLLSLDPFNCLQLDSNYDGRSLEEFIHKTVEKFTDHRNCSIKTITMQVYFMEHPIDFEHIVQRQREIIKLKTANLTKEILQCDFQMIKDDREKQFKKISVDCVVNYSLGNPANCKLIQEIQNALSSVMSLNDLNSFSAQNPADRLKSLVDIREIVCGIHIFNRDLGLSTEKSVDVKQTVLSGFKTTKSQLYVVIDENENRIKILTSALRQCIVHNQSAGSIEFDKNITNGISDEEYERLKNLLIIFRQYAEILKSLVHSLTFIKSDINESLKKFSDKLRLIHEIVKYRTAIPTDKIFPHFRDLAQCWLHLQDQIYVLTEINTINEYLMQLTDNCSTEPWEDLAFTVIGESKIKSDDEWSAELSKQKILQIDDNVHVIEFKDDYKIENFKFCTWTLVNGNGLLLPANLNINVCKFKEKYYGFCSKFAAKEFQENPEKYIFNVIEISRHHPELIIFLDNFNEVKLYRDDYHRVENTAVTTNLNSRNVRSMDVQTDVHPLPPNRLVNKGYMWNVWDLRRQAQKLADLRKHKTHSTQTTNMSFQFGKSTQTYSPRSNSKGVPEKCGLEMATNT